MSSSRNIFYKSAWLLSFVLAFLTICLHLNVWKVPVFFVLAGIFLAMKNVHMATRCFLFCLPWISALASVSQTGLPFNYLGIPLFFLSGIIMVTFIFRKNKIPANPYLHRYFFFLIVVLISVFMLLLRWSNLLIPGNAFFADTPVTPNGPRLSFAIIFPVISLFLAATAPLIAGILKKSAMSIRTVIRSLSAGYLVSFVFALIQKFLVPAFLSTPYFIKYSQYNGGCSDFNALGFFSGAIFLAAFVQWHREIPELYRSYAEKSVNLKKQRLKIFFHPSSLFYLLVMFCSLGGLSLSGSRTGFIFVLVAGLAFFLSPHFSRKFKLILCAASVVMLAAGGGVLSKRLAGTVTSFWTLSQNGQFVEALDKASNQRITMFRSGIKIFSQAPLSGTGSGNYLFHLKKIHFGKPHLEDLPLNQYLLAAAETGIPGLLFFVWFLLPALRRPQGSFYLLLIWAAMAAFLVGTPLWLPELAVLFWIFVFLDSENISHSEKKGKIKYIPFILIVFYCAAALIEMPGLAPRSWCAQVNEPYDYGLWPADRINSEQSITWSKGRSGIYMPARSKVNVRIHAAAPFEHMAGKSQSVRVYWKGKLLRDAIFKKNGFTAITFITSKGGFLEFEVQPVFNLKRLGLGCESRNLGVQVENLSITP